MEAIVKFFENDEPSSEAKLISKTFGKIAVIARVAINRKKKDPETPWPQNQEFWRVRVLKELRRGVKGGCFLVEPIERIPKEEVLYLLPGMYTTRVNHRCLIATPLAEYKHRACILPLDHKHGFSETLDAYCCIVDVSTKVQVKETKPRFTEGNPYGPK